MVRTCGRCGREEWNKWKQCVPCKREANRRRRAKPDSWENKNPRGSVTCIRRWEKKHPEKKGEYANRRRARKLGSTSEPYSFREICNHYGNKCVSCERGDQPLTVDHIIPISKGGEDTIENVQPLCRVCNSRKGSHHTTDYRPDKGPPTPRQLKFWE